MRKRHTLNLTIDALSRLALSATSLLLAAAAIAQPLPEYTAPRAVYGDHPDLNGIWQALNSAHWNVEAHSEAESPILEMGAIGAMPAGIGVVEGGVIPYRPEALAQRKENFVHRIERDPEVKCYLPGVPRATYMPYPFQIFQTEDYVLIAHEYAGAVRTVYMKDQIEAPAESWMGWSNGHWEGDTLVIETDAFIGDTWLDRSGNFHSEELKVTERITPRSDETLMYEVTLTDPQVYTKPWKMKMPLYRRVEENAQLNEFKCVALVEQLIYGHLSRDNYDGNSAPDKKE